MRISQCIIAKNEEKNIGYCLSHLKEFVNEQIVIDTGSSDKTVEIAENMGADVYHFDWIDDFSAARNYAISKAKGDWIIFLDCDEYFAESSMPWIEQCIEKSGEYENVSGIMCELINIDANNNVLSTIKSISPRIFKNKKNIKYKNKIHEILCDENRPEFDCKLINSDAAGYLKIIHTGYDEKIIKEKNKTKRDIRLIKRELEEDPENAMLSLYLSKSLYNEKEYEQSVYYAKIALKHMKKKSKSDIYCTAYSTMLYSMLAMGKTYDEMHETFDEAVRNYPNYPDYYRVLGAAALKENKFKLSSSHFEECIHYCNNYNSNIESVALGQIKEIYSDLLSAYILDDNKPKIVEITAALLSADKYDLEYLTVLMKTLLTREKEEAIANFFTRIYDYNVFKDKLYLIKASKSSGNQILLGYYESLLSSDELMEVRNSDLL